MMTMIVYLGFLLLSVVMSSSWLSLSVFLGVAGAIAIPALLLALRVDTGREAATGRRSATRRRADPHIRRAHEFTN